MASLRLLCAVTLGLVGCASAPEAGTPRNLLVNGSFERGRDPWYDFQRPEKPYWGTFEISDERAFEGRHSLRLRLDSADFPGSVGIAGAVQDVTTAVMPRKLSGRYRVDLWERGAPAQYVQLVAMAFGASNFARQNASVQLALVLAGIEAPPFEISNRAFAFAGPLEPEQGSWIRFEFDLHEQFERHWGGVPMGIRGVRLFAEVRFDQLRRGAGRRARGVVHFDALHLGD